MTSVERLEEEKIKEFVKSIRSSDRYHEPGTLSSALLKRLDKEYKE